MRLFSAFSLLILTLGSALAGPLPDTIAAALARARIPDSHIGLVVHDLARNEPDLIVGGQRSFNPASVMKLVTTLAALDILGPAHTFKTAILTDGTVNNGVLNGNLVLRGGGDPALTQERFHLLLREVRDRGIQEIRGDVIIDNSFYAVSETDPGAFDGAPLEPYNALPSAFLVNFNVLALRLQARPDGVEARLEPGGAQVDNLITLDRTGVCNGWQDRLALTGAGTRLRAAGPYAAACGDRATWLALLPSTSTSAAYFKRYWQELGGRLSGQVRDGIASPTAVPMFEFASMPLADLVRDTNKFSNNVMAKMLLLNLGAARYGGPTDWNKGTVAVRVWLAEKGLDIPELVLENGSGLSRIERISAASMARLLVWAAGQPLYYEFAASLPALGVEGTQKKRLNGSPEAGRAWLKSGSLNGARNLAGYVLDANGRRKAVVLFINHAGASKADGVQAEVLRWAITGKGALP